LEPNKMTAKKHESLSLPQSLCGMDDATIKTPKPRGRLKWC
jgi:hypothetical protein